MRDRVHQTDAALKSRSNDVTGIISEIWLRTLGPKASKANASLIRSGLGALRIFRMLDEIERELGVTIPIATALKLGTVKGIAAAIQTDRWPSPSPLILLKDGQDHSPLYLVPGGVGLILELCSLAAKIDYPGKIWGLNLQGYEGDTPRLGTVGDMAADLADNLPVNQNEPINIIGYSFGGLLAVEMVRLLRQKNCRLGFLGLIDPPLAERQWPLTTRIRHLLRRTIARVNTMLFISPERRMESLTKIGRLIVKRLLGMLIPHAALSSYQDKVPSTDDRVKIPKQLILTAHELYAPKPVDCPVVLFKAMKSVKAGVDTEEMWRPVLSNLEVVEVNGTHASAIVPPFVDGLAAEISSRLQAPAPLRM